MYFYFLFFFYWLIPLLSIPIKIDILIQLPLAPMVFAWLRCAVSYFWNQMAILTSCILRTNEDRYLFSTFSETGNGTAQTSEKIRNTLVRMPCVLIRLRQWMRSGTCRKVERSPMHCWSFGLIRLLWGRTVFISTDGTRCKHARSVDWVDHRNVFVISCGQSARYLMAPTNVCDFSLRGISIYFPLKSWFCFWEKASSPDSYKRLQK